jgi:glutamine amidotransferase
MRSLLDELVLQKKVPVLGICVGMQILANSSEEGVLSGLGWIDGKIMKLDSSKHKLQLPHMGWNTITPTSSNKLLDTFDKSTRFYFLHSYYFKCNNADDELGKTEYGISFSSAVNSGNIYGVQFHPEKSHENGIKVLKNFANL